MFGPVRTVGVLTIQKRVPVVKSAYCSMVDSTLKIRHTRTMRKLDEDETFLSQTSPTPTGTVFTHSLAHARQPIVCNKLKQTGPVSLAVLSQDVVLLCVFFAVGFACANSRRDVSTSRSNSETFHTRRSICHRICVVYENSLAGLKTQRERT